MSFVRQTVKALLSLGLPPQRWLAHGPRARLTDAPTISLTFDDGPHPEHTPRILDELQRWGQKATFFVIGREAKRYPALMQRIVDEGHVIGNHTYTHGEPALTSTKAFLEEVRRTTEVLKPWTGEPARWVRPPKGVLTWQKLRGLWKAGYTPVLWNVDPRDCRMSSPTEADRWCMAYKPEHGDIVLLHDNRPFALEMLAVWGTTGMFAQWRSVSIDAWIEKSTLSPVVEALSQPRQDTLVEKPSTTKADVARSLPSATLPAASQATAHDNDACPLALIQAEKGQGEKANAPSDQPIRRGILFKVGTAIYALATAARRSLAVSRADGGEATESKQARGRAKKPSSSRVRELPAKSHDSQAAEKASSTIAAAAQSPSATDLANAARPIGGFAQFLSPPAHSDKRQSPVEGAGRAIDAHPKPQLMPVTSAVEKSSTIKAAAAQALPAANLVAASDQPTANLVSTDPSEPRGNSVSTTAGSAIASVAAPAPPSTNVTKAIRKLFSNWIFKLPGTPRQCRVIETAHPLKADADCQPLPSSNLPAASGNSPPRRLRMAELMTPLLAAKKPPSQ